MSLLQSHRFVARTTDGRAAPDTDIEVRKQGATILAVNSLTSFDVAHIGRIEVGDVVAVDTDLLESRNVLTVTGGTGGGTITVDAPGLSIAQVGSRLTVQTPLPSIFEDINGNDAAINPLIADATGSVEWYSEGPIDLFVAGDGVRTTLYDDWDGSGDTSIASVVDPDSGQAAFEWDTERLFGDDDLLFHLKNDGATKFAIEGDGDVTIPGRLTVTGDVSTSDDVTVAALLTAAKLKITSTADDAADIDGQLTVNRLVVESATNFSLPNSVITVPMLAFSLSAAGVGVTMGENSTDYTFTTSYATITGLSANFTPVGAGSKTFVLAIVPWEVVGIGDGPLSARLIRDPAGGPAVTEHEVFDTRISGGLNGGQMILFSSILTGATANQVYTVEVKKGASTGTTVVKGTTDRKARILIVEIQP